MKKLFYCALVMGICSIQSATIYFKNNTPIPNEDISFFGSKFTKFTVSPYNPKNTKVDFGRQENIQGMPDKLDTDWAYMYVRSNYIMGDLNDVGGVSVPVIDGKEYVISLSDDSLRITPFNKQ